MKTNNFKILLPAAKKAEQKKNEIEKV